MGAAAGDLSVVSQSAAIAPEAFTAAIQTGDRIAAESSARRLLSDGMSLLELYELLTDAMEIVGDCWAAGEMSVAEEHAATAAATYVVHRLRGAPPAASRGSVLLLTLESERHVLGLDVLGHLFEAARFRTVAIGDAPLDDVIDFANRLPDLQAVLVSAHVDIDAARLQSAVRTLRKRANAPRVVVGGSAFRRRTTSPARYAADAVLLSARDALAYVTAATSPLTEREMQVLACVAEGMSNADTAARLGIAASTVKDHVESICRKLGASSRTAAVTVAMRSGLLG